MKARTVRNIQAIAVLVGGLAAAIFVPEDTLLPIAIGSLAVSVAAVWFIRKKMEKLDPRYDGPQRAFWLEVGMVFGMAAVASLIMLLVIFD